MKSTDLRNTLKATFQPYIESKGFVKNKQCPNLSVMFKKTQDDIVYIAEIQWDKYNRPAFTFHAGFGSISSAMKKWGYTSDSEIFANSLEHHCSLNAGTGTYCRWFTQKNSVWNRLLFKSKYRLPEDVVSQFMSLFSEIEQFWTTGELGPHCHTIPAVHAAKVKP